MAQNREDNLDFQDFTNQSLHEVQADLLNKIALNHNSIQKSLLDLNQDHHERLNQTHANLLKEVVQNWEANLDLQGSNNQSLTEIQTNLLNKITLNHKSIQKSLLDLNQDHHERLNQTHANLLKEAVQN